MNKQKIVNILKVVGSWFLVFTIVLLGFLTGYFSGRKYLQDTAPISSSELEVFANDTTTYSWQYVSGLPVGFTSTSGLYIWSDGTNIYYSNASYHYMLNTSTKVWSPVSFTGLTSFSGQYIWSDGVSVYYSNSSSQYVLNTTTNTWSTMSFTGLTSFNGDSVWYRSANQRYYYTTSTSRWVYDISDHSWSTSSLTNPVNGTGVWSDPYRDVVYYSSGSTQKLLASAGTGFVNTTWSGLTSFTAAYVWYYGNNAYYSSGNSQYVLDSSVQRTWNVSDFPMLNSDGRNYFYYSGFLGYVDGTSFYFYGAEEPEPSPEPDVPSGDDTLTTQFVSSWVATSKVGLYDYIYNDDTANLFFKFMLDTSSYNDSTSLNYRKYVATLYLEVKEYILISDATAIVADGSHSASIILSNDTLGDVSIDVESRDLVNLNFYKVQFSTFAEFDTDIVYDYLTLFVSNSSYIRFTITHDCSDLTDSIYEDIGVWLDSVGWCRNSEVRSYYLQTTQIDDNFNSGYEQGFADGTNRGYQQGVQNGYQNGYNNGYQQGLGVGYNDGLQASGQYTFMSLIGAVIDAPITAFTGLFDFTLLGVNIKDFLFGLLTIVMVVWIIGLVLGKR